MNETEISEISELSELYNFNYNCVYKYIKHDEENDDLYNKKLYNIKLYGIFIFLNNNEDTKHIFNLLRKKMPTEFHDENDISYNHKLFCHILSYNFLHLYHPCICDIYHDNVIKSENLNKLLTFLDNIKHDI